MSRTSENCAFVCANCGQKVLPLTNGSYRNHCPRCLYSLHVDNLPGDRSGNCGGLMKPIKLIYSRKKGYQIVHKCQLCGFERPNKIAEYTVMPDDYSMIITLSHNQT